MLSLSKHGVEQPFDKFRVTFFGNSSQPCHAEPVEALFFYDLFNNLI